METAAGPVRPSQGNCTTSMRNSHLKLFVDCNIHTCTLIIQFSTFRTAAQRLMSDAGVGGSVGEAKGEAPSDYNLMAQLECLVADYKELKDTVKCLGSSLQQLEQGFKTGYSDTLTILQTKA